MHVHRNVSVLTTRSPHTSEHKRNDKAWRTKHLPLGTLQLQLQNTVFFAEIHHHVVHHASGIQGATLVLLLNDLAQRSGENMHQSGNGDR